MSAREAVVRLRKLPSHWRRFNGAAASLGRSPIALFPRLLLLLGPGRYRAAEIHRLELLGLPAAQLDDYVSKRRMTRIQARLNPPDLAGLADDKSIFYRFIDGAGIPNPGVIAELDTAAPEKARRALAALDPGELVIKPSRGYYGRGFMLVDHAEGRFTTPERQQLSAEELLRRLDTDREFGRWLIQPRVFNHPEVDAISPSPALQTLRIVTFVDDSDQAQVIASQWRLARPGSLTDNFRGGEDGNMLGNVDVETGRLVSVLRLGAGGTGMETLAAHPDSGIALPGLPIPFWQDAAALAKRAALVMLPMRSIGWDVALTPSGPMIIEANQRWDPQNADGGMGKRLRFMAARTTLFRFASLSWRDYLLRRDP